MSVSNRLSSRDTAAMAVQISDYVDRVAIKKGEFEKVASAIKNVFSSMTNLSDHELKARISRIGRITDLSETTKSSLKERLSSVAEIYNEPESWVNKPQQYVALKAFVLDSVKRKAEQLAHFSDGEKDRYIGDLAAQQDQSRATQALLQSARATRSNVSSTLNDDQQHEEITLRSYILQKGLGNLSDPTIPMHDDTELLRVLAQTKEHRSILEDLPKLFTSSKPAALVLLSESLKQLSDFAPELRDDEEVVLAAVHQDGTALQFASTRLKGDKDVAFAAMRQDPSALRFAGDALQTNGEFMRTASAMLEGAYKRTTSN